jgi:hypothetical protein
MRQGQSFKKRKCPAGLFHIDHKIGNRRGGKTVMEVSRCVLLRFAGFQSKLLRMMLLHLEVLEFCVGLDSRTKEQMIGHIEAFRTEERDFYIWLDAKANAAERQATSAAEREEIRAMAKSFRRMAEDCAEKFRKVIDRYFADEGGGRRLYLEREIVP